MIFLYYIYLSPLLLDYLYIFDIFPSKPLNNPHEHIDFILCLFICYFYTDCNDPKNNFYIIILIGMNNDY